MPSFDVLEVLACARQIAGHAERLGIEVEATFCRPSVNHLGAVLADSVLQSGLNYRTVVRPRIDRINVDFPHAARLSGVIAIINDGLIFDFLLWRHPIKILRFTQLAAVLGAARVEDTDDLRQWLKDGKARDTLLALNGVGPKTYDYMCCLVGIDCIPIDRHIRTFASEAGISARDYYSLQAVVSCAADLLGVPRRDFDAWIWNRRAQQFGERHQLEMPLNCV